VRLRDGYSSALRSIGQALERADIDAFDLKCDNDEFRLQCGDPTPPNLSLIELRYSLEDIERLEVEGRAKRGDSFRTVDFDGLPQILRTLGRYVDNRGGGLLRICNSDASAPAGAIKIEYTSRDGQLKAEELSMASIYQHSVQMYQERTRISDDIQEGPERFSRRPS
jgi:hypothetical protein